jgi:hypothetical protein
MLSDTFKSKFIDLTSSRGSRSPDGPVAAAANKVASFKRPYRNCLDHTDLGIQSFLLRGSPDRDLSFVGTNPTDEPITGAVGTTITDRPRTDPYERVYAYGSYEG